MKKVLQYSGVISALLAIVAIVLALATPAMRYTGLLSETLIPGTTALFGETTTVLGKVVIVYKPSALALIGWILALAGVIVVLCGVILPLLKVKGIKKFAGIMNLFAVVVLVLAGVFMFLVVPTFAAANFDGHTDGLAMGAGWVIAAILAIAAGAFAILPAAVDFLGKKK